VAAVVGHRIHVAASASNRRRDPGQPEGGYTSPIVWPPPLTYPGTRRAAARVLPGVRYRRRLYWRYSLIWHRPP